MWRTTSAFVDNQDAGRVTIKNSWFYFLLVLIFQQLSFLKKHLWPVMHLPKLYDKMHTTLQLENAVFSLFRRISCPYMLHQSHKVLTLIATCHSSFHGALLRCLALSHFARWGTSLWIQWHWAGTMWYCQWSSFLFSCERYYYIA